MTSLSTLEDDSSSEDTFDIFSSSLSTVFSIESPAITTQTLTLHGITVSPPSPLASNWNLHADAIWKCSLYLANSENAPDVKGKAVLELGAASGMLGLILAHRDGASRVVLSDYPDPNILSTLEKNITRNRLEATVKVVGHRWGVMDDWQGDEGFDVIVGGDILWLIDQHENLCKTLAHTLKKNARSLVRLGEGSQSGKWTIDGFRREAEKAGFCVHVLEQASLLGSEHRPWDGDRMESDVEKRQWLTIIELKWANSALE